MGPESFGPCPQEEPREESWGGVLAGTLGGEESQEKSCGGRTREEPQGEDYGKALGGAPGGDLGLGGKNEGRGRLRLRFVSQTASHPSPCSLCEGRWRQGTLLPAVGLPRAPGWPQTQLGF